VGGSTHTPLIRKLDCLQLPVSDLEAGIAFSERLGHEVIWRRPHQAGLRLPDTDAELELLDMSKGPLGPRPARVVS
jgi:hypothetical protein